MDAMQIEKLRKRGLTEMSPEGAECVRVSIQQGESAQGLSRVQLKDRMAAWIDAMQSKLAQAGGFVIPDSVSVVAQTVEALIPVDRVQSSTVELAKEGARIDLVEPRQVI